jgi:hypothetical protein
MNKAASTFYRKPVTPVDCGGKYFINWRTDVLNKCLFQSLMLLSFDSWCGNLYQSKLPLRSVHDSSLLFAEDLFFSFLGYR